jgi:NhaP-type Na+/H+ and K+/H+ antiporters
MNADHPAGVSAIELAAIVLVASAALGWLNHRVIRMPHTIGMLVMALAASLGLIAIDAVFPWIGIAREAEALLKNVDFAETLLKGMLAFLLFAGALHVDITTFRKLQTPILSMATAGVLISTAVIGVALWWIAGMLGIHLPLAWALVFGAIISPTDPIAVISILKRVAVPKKLYATVEGESLFNDGMALIAFTVLVAFAVGRGTENFNITMLVGMFTIEAGGAILLGLLAGRIAVAAIKRTNETSIEVLITLALVTGLYALSSRLHVSGPIAVVVAGIFIGNRAPGLAMTEESKKVLFGFWHVIDEILNSVLFLLIGAEVLLIGRDLSFLPLAAAAVPVMIFGRYASVAIPVALLSMEQKFERGTITLLTWGGVRGGISVALALNLPDSPYKATILGVTYAVVVFSVVIQGLTVRGVIERFVLKKDSPLDEGTPTDK